MAMRGGRSFVILVVVALGLGAYIYFVESQRDVGPSIVEGDPVFAIDTGTIEEVQIRSTSGETTTVRHDDGTWRIVEPATLPADISAVGSVLSTLETLTTERTVDEAPISVAEYGLDPARLSIAFRVTGDATLQRLDLGDLTPTGADLYARVEGDPKLILIASFHEASFDKTAFDLRDKQVLDFSRDGVDTLRIAPADGEAVSLAKVGDGWRLSEPVDARGDLSAVDGIVSSVFGARMTSVAHPADPADTTEPDADDLRRFGLDRPAVTVTLGEGSTRATLAVGAENDAGARYARDLSRPIVFAIESSVFDALTTTADDLRAKDLFAFRSFTAVGVDLAFDGTARTYEKRTTTSDDDPPTTTDSWVDTSPDAGDLDQAAVTNLLTSISNLRADAFASRALSSGEEFVVTARFGDAASPDEERVVFRRDGDTVHAIREGEPGAAIVVTADFDRALTLFKELAGIQ